MATRKFRDWSSWWDGLRTQSVKAGATSLVTNLTLFMSTNAVAALPIDALKTSGENWKTLCIGLVAQFGLHTLLAAAQYIQNNPDAQIITETVDTQHIVRDAKTGIVTEAGSSTTVTVKPTIVEPPK